MTEGDAYFEIIYLPCYNHEQNYGLKDGPPLDTGVCRLCGIPVLFLADQDVFLLVFDSFQVTGQKSDFSLDRCDGVCSLVLACTEVTVWTERTILPDVNDAMNVETA